MTSRDIVYGRRGGRIVAPSGVNLNGPRCDACGRPMTVGQTGRHFVCDDLLPCCGWPAALVPDLAAHQRAHDEAAR